jgi:hypothetical protein
MPRLALAALLASALAASGCTIDKAVGGGARLSPALAADCADHCRTLDMRLTAVVVVANRGGCVCDPKDRPSASVGGGAAAAGGAVVLQQTQQQSSPTPPRH